MTLFRLLLSFVLAATLASAADAKPKKKPLKKKPSTESKYRSTELSEGASNVYRFDSKGNPIVQGEKKSKPKAKKNRSEPPEETAEGSACEGGDACPAKGSEADAL